MNSSWHHKQRKTPADTTNKDNQQLTANNSWQHKQRQTTANTTDKDKQQLAAQTRKKYQLTAQTKTGTVDSTKTDSSWHHKNTQATTDSQTKTSTVDSTMTDNSWHHKQTQATTDSTNKDKQQLTPQRQTTDDTTNKAKQQLTAKHTISLNKSKLKWISAKTLLTVIYLIIKETKACQRSSLKNPTTVIISLISHIT